MIINILKCPYCHEIAMIYKGTLFAGDILESGKCLFPKVGHGEQCACGTCGKYLDVNISKWCVLDLSDYFL